MTPRSTAALTECLDHYDAELRSQALRIDCEYGEDAYHEVVCSLLERPRVLKNTRNYIARAVKWMVWKIHRDMSTRVRNETRCLYNRPDPRVATQFKTQRYCKNGHALTDDNLRWFGKLRMCKICCRETQREYYHQVRKQKMLTGGADGHARSAPST